MITKNRNLGRYLQDNNIPAISAWAGHEQILVGRELSGYEQKIIRYEQIQVGTDPETNEPIFADGDPIYGDDRTKPIFDGTPIYEDGDELFELVWTGTPGTPPTEEELAAFVPSPVEPSPLTDVEKMQAGVQARLDGDEEKRTGVRPNQSGAVPLSRSWAATAMLYAGWHYPTEADLAAGANPAILAKIYADPTTNTTDKSSVAQKQRALHFTLVMLEGQAFGLDYQAELGAYERTASGAFLAKLALDKRDWLDLPVHTWPSVRAMFADLMG